MRLTVERVVDSRKKLVATVSGLGRVSVVWEGDLPSPTSEHDVELDVPGILEWGHEIWRASDAPVAWDPVNEIAGTLAALDELGVAEIDAAGTSLLVETLGEPPLGTVGERVVVRPPLVHAFPYRT